MIRIYLSIFLFLLIGNYSSTTAQESSKGSSLFSLLPSSHTGISFNNQVPVFEKMNVLISQYHYNGAGVGVADLNNDGLTDLFFVSNFSEDKLYLNKGDLKFQDISKEAGIRPEKGWETGVTMVDINHDGWTDIYVSRSGLAKGLSNDNLLYINQGLDPTSGLPTFRQGSFEFGILDFSHSTQASFFDYDRDGDLDMYLLNHNVGRINNYDFSQKEPFRDTEVGDLLFRNDNGKYTDVSEQAGIIGKKISYGLGLMVGDLNKDGWPDLYVCNDFGERDYLYINKQDGTFSEELTTTLDHIPFYSMGGDLGDINNDGWLDIMTLDMTAQDNFGQKANMNDMNPDKFYFLAEMGMHYQYMANALQVNQGIAQGGKHPGSLKFSDISMMAGVAYTDWSWAPLFADFDNDGWQDLFISNGYRVNISNKDYVNWYQKRQQELNQLPPSQRNPAAEFQEALSKLSSDKTPNFIYRNKGDLTFSNETTAWGMEEPSFSNGVAYADLDNDGDLDLIINNLDQEAFIYKNNSSELSGNHFLRIRLEGSEKNLWGIGSKISLQTARGNQYREAYVSRGYQSAVEREIQFGLGKETVIEKLTVEWPDGKMQVLTNLKADQLLSVYYKDAKEGKPQTEPIKSLLVDITQSSGISFTHHENEYNDFEKEVLLPHKLSQLGPALAVGDVNKDGKEDFFVGGAAGQSGKLYLQQASEKFIPAASKPWEKDLESEDINALFFDVDGDKDLDLYVVSGGNEFEGNDQKLQDRIYINDGKGNFQAGAGILPEMRISGASVTAGDYDNDGDLDLFVGGRLVPGRYLHAPRSYLLNNSGGKFTDVTASQAPQLLQPGMVTDALWTDFDEDGKLDLFLLGEWMAPMMMKNQGSTFENVSVRYGLENQVGWWNCIKELDLDEDGDTDYVLGNLGTNYKYQASEEEPFEIFVRDFDENGSSDIVLGYYNQDTLFPVRGRQCSSDQMPFIKDAFSDYNSFAKASLLDIYGDRGLDKAIHIQARNFSSTVLLNQGKTFQMKALANEAQISPINGVVDIDLNMDGHRDLIIAGNMYPVEVETIRADAGKGLVLTGNGQGEFLPMAPYQSGFMADGDVKRIRPIKLGPGGVMGILLAVNDGTLRLWRP